MVSWFFGSYFYFIFEIESHNSIFHFHTTYSSLEHRLNETNIEPGYYKAGEFGIRIEDVVQVIESDIENAFDGLGALTFKSITYVPLQTKMIDRKLITDEEVCIHSMNWYFFLTIDFFLFFQLKFINEYHKRIFEVIGSRLLENNLNETFEWLKQETKEIL